MNSGRVRKKAEIVNLTVKLPYETWQALAHRKVDGHGTIDEQLQQAVKEYLAAREGGRE